MLTEESGEKTGKIIETACVIASDAKFFWRDKYKDEVDIILQNGKEIIPIEIKYRNQPGQNKGLKKFIEKYKCKKAFIITKEIRKKAKDANGIDWVLVYEFLMKF